MLTFWTAPSWFFYSISIRCLTFLFFSFAKSEMSPAKVVSAAWVWVLFVVLRCVWGPKIPPVKGIKIYITGKVLFSAQEPAPSIEPIFNIFPKILASKKGAALSSPIPRCNSSASVKDHSLSICARPGAVCYCRGISRTFQAKTPRRQRATYKAIAKNKFVRPEEGWRNHCTELRRLGLTPAAPSICSSAKIRLLRKGLQRGWNSQWLYKIN